MRRALLIAALLCWSSPGFAEAAPAAAQLARMKSWLEPARPMTRQLQITVRKPDGSSMHWTAGQARGVVDGSTWTLTVVLEPKELRGTALLVRDLTGTPDEQWLYSPAAGRVEHVAPADPLAPWLDSELARGDLGFVELDGSTVASLGKETVAGVEGEKLQEQLPDGKAVKRIVTWVAPDGRPLKREWYDADDKPWKVVTFDKVAPIHDVPTAQRVRVENARTGAGSEYRATRVAYDLPPPKELFDPAQLPKAADSPIW